MDMKFLDVLFYRYFLYYSKRTFGGEDPYLTTTFTVSASESFFLIMSLNIVNAYFFCSDSLMTKKFFFLTGIAIFVLNLYIYICLEKGVKGS